MRRAGAVALALCVGLLLAGADAGALGRERAPAWRSGAASTARLRSARQRLGAPPRLSRRPPARAARFSPREIVHPGWERPLPAPAARQLLRDVHGKVRELSRGGGKPVVLFDIDDTVVSTIARENEAARRAGERFGLKVASKAELLHGATPAQARQRTDAFKKIFLGDTSLMALDSEIPGARAYVAALHAEGARILYATARREDNRAASEAQLRRFGFPLERPEDLMLKPMGGTGTLDWKREIARRATRLGTAVAAFDNEPENARAFSEGLPGATVVRLRTVANRDDARPPPPGLKVLSGYTDWSALARLVGLRAPRR